jgi:hypothetical protein
VLEAVEGSRYVKTVEDLAAGIKISFRNELYMLSMLFVSASVGEYETKTYHEKMQVLKNNTVPRLRMSLCGFRYDRMKAKMTNKR